jgi:hypothetical protein
MPVAAAGTSDKTVLARVETAPTMFEVAAPTSEVRSPPSTLTPVMTGRPTETVREAERGSDRTEEMISPVLSTSDVAADGMSETTTDGTDPSRMVLAAAGRSVTWLTMLLISPVETP